MTWTAPMTAVAGTIFTASQYNTYIRDNLLETEAAKATEADQYFVVNGINSIAARKYDTAYISAGEAVTSGTFGDMATPGPTVTVETGTRAIVMLSAGMQPTSVNNMYGFMGFQVSGASSIAASDTESLFMDGITAGTGNIRIGVAYMTDGLTPGTNVFQCKYRTDPGDSFTFFRRRLIVVPL